MTVPSLVVMSASSVVFFIVVVSCCDCFTASSAHSNPHSLYNYQFPRTLCTPTLAGIIADMQNLHVWFAMPSIAKPRTKVGPKIEPRNSAGRLWRKKGTAFLASTSSAPLSNETTVICRLCLGGAFGYLYIHITCSHVGQIIINRFPLDLHVAGKTDS